MATVELGVVTLHEDQRLRRSLFLAGFVILLYDHLLTLGSEVRNIWSPKFKRSSAWFLLFRYVTLLGNLTMIPFFLGDLSAELSKIENYVLVAQEFFIGCAAKIIRTLSLRVCAMYGFNRKVFISLAIAALTTVGLGAWAVVGPKVILETSVPGCYVTTSKDQRGIGMGRPRCPNLSLFSLTLSTSQSGDVSSLPYLRVARLRIFRLLPLEVWPGLPADPEIYSNTFDSISVTMISRLMLNLHDAANQQLEVGTSLSQEHESIQFRQETIHTVMV
ncbi:hypothetical protein B0H19DRAFT_1072597 [Mycena capillaripes]|nr:hypothetical protein B0H19DRAFT_1072597 [Mycena capillaripes]